MPGKRPLDYESVLSASPARALRARLEHLRRVLAPAALAAVCIGFSWFLYWSLGGAFSLFFPVPIVYLLISRRWRGAIAFLLLNPFTMFTLIDCVGYARGTPRFVLPIDHEVYREQYSIDPVTRVRSWFSDCGTHDPNYWVGIATGHTAIRIMFPFIGPPPGAYDGPYPTRAQAIQALRSAMVVPVSFGGPKSITFPSGPVKLDPERLMSCTSAQRASGPIRIALWIKRCLIMEVPRDDERGTRWIEVQLLDARNSQPFCMYILPWPSAAAASSQPATEPANATRQLPAAQ